MTRIKLLLTEGKKRPHDNGLEAPENYEIASKTDQILMERAVIVFRENVFSMLVCMLSGLLCLMYVPSIVNVLSKTGNSRTKEKAFVRYLKTMIHTIRWFNADPKERLASLKCVRKIHSGVSSINPFTQFDMVVTQWAFIAPALLFPVKLGVDHLSSADKMALVHVMKSVGKRLGIDDDLNLCISDDLDEVLDYCRDIHQEVIIPALKTTYEFQEGDSMALHLLEGMQMFNPYILPKPFGTWVFRLMGSPKLVYYETLMAGFFAKREQGLYRMQIELFEEAMSETSRISGITRSIVNTLMLVNVYLAELLQSHIVVTWRRMIM